MLNVERENTRSSLQSVYQSFLERQDNPLFRDGDAGYKMSHAEFVLAYENGRLGCSVSVLVTLRLFLAGKIREKRVSIHLRLWLLAITVLTAASVIGFLKFPAVWALLGTIALLAICAVAFFYSVGGVVLSALLANQEFYEFATEQRILWIYSDDEENAPKVRNSSGEVEALQTLLLRGIQPEDLIKLKSTLDRLSETDLEDLLSSRGGPPRKWIVHRIIHVKALYLSLISDFLGSVSLVVATILLFRLQRAGYSSERQRHRPFQFVIFNQSS